MYLVNTNVWLERLLDQARAEQVDYFLDRISSKHLFITDFAFHSMGLVMIRFSPPLRSGENEAVEQELLISPPLRCGRTRSSNRCPSGTAQLPRWTEKAISCASFKMPSPMRTLA
jgi:hypothetical protein